MTLIIVKIVERLNMIQSDKRVNFTSLKSAAELAFTQFILKLFQIARNSTFFVCLNNYFE